MSPSDSPTPHKMPAPRSGAAQAASSDVVAFKIIFSGYVIASGKEYAGRSGKGSQLKVEVLPVRGERFW